MPHNIEIKDNVFLMKEGIKYEKYSLGKAQNITIDGKLVPKTRVEHSPPPIPQLQEMGEDGILKWREDGKRRPRKAAQPG